MEYEQGQNQVRFNRAIRTMDNGFEYDTFVIGTVIYPTASLVYMRALAEQIPLPTKLTKAGEL
jgi:hypothetical protein